MVERVQMSASVEEQVAWARGSALVVAAAERCVLEVTGGDRLSWLNGLLTCQLVGRSAGEAVHGLAVAQKGKIVSDVVVLVGEELARVVVERATVDTLVASFDHHLMMEDAELRRSGDAVWFVHGPRAADVLAAARAAGGAGGLLDVTGDGGAVVVGPADGSLGDALAHAAAGVGGGPGDLAGWDVVRVLAGVGRFGVDFDDATYPQEAALEAKAVSFDKGCYLGQEVVCMLELRGHVKRKLVSLALASNELPAPRAVIDDGHGAPVGEVTSAARAPDGSVRALGMVKYAFIAKGTALVVGGSAATVA
jgi:folate-binding protein YgfZ